MFDWIPVCDHCVFLPHLALFVFCVASVVPHKCQPLSKVAFHSLFGILLFFSPDILNGPKVAHHLDSVHIFLQRFVGAYHFGFAFYYFQNREDSFRAEPAIQLAKTLTAGLVAVNELYSSQRYTSATERGVHLDAENFFYAAIFVDLAFFLASLYEYLSGILSSRTADEVDIMCKHTQRLIEHGGAIGLQHAFWADAVFSILYAVASISATEYLYLNVIEHGIQLDNVHSLYTAEFGHYALGAAIASLIAPQFTPNHLQAYVQQRLITQLAILTVHFFGSYSIYPSGQFVPHIVALGSLIPIYWAKKFVDQIDDQNDTVKRSGSFKKRH